MQEENENLARHMKDFTSLSDGDWAVDFVVVVFNI